MEAIAFLAAVYAICYVIYTMYYGFHQTDHQTESLFVGAMILILHLLYSASFVFLIYFVISSILAL